MIEKSCVKSLVILMNGFTCIDILHACNWSIFFKKWKQSKNKLQNIQTNLDQRMILQTYEKILPGDGVVTLIKINIKIYYVN